MGITFILFFILIFESSLVRDSLSHLRRYDLESNVDTYSWHRQILYNKFEMKYETFFSYVSPLEILWFEFPKPSQATNLEYNANL